jgi:hypothetical protein
MIVRTRFRLPGDPREVWPLLCESAMDRSQPCLFRLGAPKPVECRLPSGPGAVGARRECISDQGRVGQRIVRWEPPSLLAFEMVETDLFFGRYLDAIEERFDLVARGRETAIVRTTKLTIKPQTGGLRRLLLRIGLKRVHRYVFRNWAASLRGRRSANRELRFGRTQSR